MKIHKNLNLDKIRLIAALMVIAIHTFPLTCINETLDYMLTRVLFRIAVPMFLMITGYFVLPKSVEDKASLLDYLKKIIKIYFISIIIYLPINIKNIEAFNILSILKSILFTGTFYHLWYFPALILGIIVTYAIIKYLPKKSQLPIVIILYIIGIFGDNYYWLVSNIKAINIFYDAIFKITDYTRNFLFFVPMFLILGYKVSTQKTNVNIKKSFIYITSSILIMLYEGVIIKNFGFSKHTSMYITLPILSYFLFKFLTSNCNKKSEANIRKLATDIYIIHPLMIIILTYLKRYMHILNNSIIFYILVVITSLTICLLFRKIINRKGTDNKVIEF